MHVSNLSKTFDQVTFTVVDTETTGLSPQKGARLVEIGAVKVEPGYRLNLQNHFSELINPGCPIPYQAYQVHGISDAMVADKPPVHQVMPGFADFVKGTVVVAHNARFDMNFLNHFMKETGIAADIILVLDTIALAKKAYPRLPSYSLDSLIRHTGIKVPVSEGWRHRALYDAAHTAVLLMNCLTELNRREFCTLQDIMQL